ncbi:MAG TPA: manganase accumulation protein MntS [Franconibacter helveticus]|nr:manganase accumulation protein MntS [Franconibacter helveticus]MDU6923019.1 manganase accumulation protein MntS [Franconibacter helveticus]HAZ53446.1 manganase accumulation protein MntS [Franconibacter helveticus]
MNEFKRCMNVFSHSPFQVRLLLLNLLCGYLGGKPQPEAAPRRRK